MNKNDLTPTSDEQRLGDVSRGQTPVAPDRGRLLAAAYAASNTKIKETTMLPNWITRSFTGKSPALRFTLGVALLLAVLAVSLVLPRGGSMNPATAAWGATEGYLLAFDFGDQDQAAVQPILDQLKAKVQAFKEAHGLPTGWSRSAASVNAERKVVKRIVKHSGDAEAGSAAPETTEEEHQRLVVMVALPDASLIDALKKELATISGLPEPQLTDSTWFTTNGFPDPSQPGINIGVNLGDNQHMFNFPEGTTEEQMESEINAWLTENRPDSQSTVNVTLSGDAKNRTIQVEITSKSEKTE